MVKLVTGGAGFIGSHLVHRLVKEKEEVIVIDDLSLGKEENLAKVKNKITFYKRSICEDLSDIFKKHSIDCIFHIAAIPRVQFSIAQPMETHEANVNGTLNLLNLCKRFGVKRFVFSSSSSIYGDQETMPLLERMEPNPMSPYALHKLIGEHYCKLFSFLYGIETVSLRYFNVYGSRQSPDGGYACLIPKFAKMFIDGVSPVINGDGNQTRDFTYVGDVVEANILAAKTENKEAFGNYVNIGGGQGYSVNTVTQQIKDLLGTSVEYKYGPVVIEPKHTLASTQKAFDLLGWKPQVDFTEGLKETIESFKKKK